MENEKTKINLGSGPDGIDGWDNLDWGLLPLVSKFGIIQKILIKVGLLDKNYLLSWPKIRLCDIRGKLPYTDNSIEQVYCSHVLEHLEKWQTINLLKEVKRILKKGGIMRIVLPDLKKILEVYSKNGADQFCRVLWGFDKDIKPNNLIKSLQRKFIRPHQWMYNKKSFEEVIKISGFGNFKWLDYKIGEVQSLDKLDLDIHKELSMYVEIKK